MSLDGDFWSKNATTTTTNTYNLGSPSSNSYPAYPNARWYGFPVHCVVITNTAPRYFARSGYITAGTASMRFLSDAGTFWSEIVSTMANAYILHSYGLNVYSSNSSARWNGFSVRS